MKNGDGVYFLPLLVKTILPMKLQHYTMLLIKIDGTNKRIAEKMIDSFQRIKSWKLRENLHCDFYRRALYTIEK